MTRQRHETSEHNIHKQISACIRLDPPWDILEVSCMLTVSPFYVSHVGHAAKHADHLSGGDIRLL